MTNAPLHDATTHSTDEQTHAAVGEIRISAARRIGARAGALAGLTLGMGMIAAASVLDHTTPSVAG